MNGEYEKKLLNVGLNNYLQQIAPNLKVLVHIVVINGLIAYLIV